jgi:hypothetical protein
MNLKGKTRVVTRNSWSAKHYAGLLEQSRVKRSSRISEKDYLFDLLE